VDGVPEGSVGGVGGVGSVGVAGGGGRGDRCVRSFLRHSHRQPPPETGVLSSVIEGVSVDQSVAGHWSRLVAIGQEWRGDELRIAE